MAELKAQMRHQVRQRLRLMSEAERVTASAQARVRLVGQALWQRAQLILFFVPLADEVDLWPLVARALEQGKRVSLPRFAADQDAYEVCEVEAPERDLAPGKFGILEPTVDRPLLATKQLDLILVPGLAFDQRGGRLGRGHGYFDRLLPCLRGHRCGAAFDEQIVEHVPAEPHDALVNSILTPTRWVELAAARGTME